MSVGPPGTPPPPQPFYPPGGYSYPPPYVRQEAQGATPSMVLGILSLVFLPVGCCCGLGEVVVIPLGVIAVVLGFSARSKVAASQGALGGDGKALAGIVTGATGAAIGIVLLVLGLLLFGLGTTGFFNVIPTASPGR